MFYKTSEPHGLAHDPFKAIVAPRPIGWISTLSKSGAANLAPYSFFNAVSDHPHMVLFSSAQMKDSAANARDTGEFTCNYVSHNLIDAMNVSSGNYPHGADEFELAGLEKAAGQTVNCPRVATAFAALECKLIDIVNPTGLDGRKSAYHLVIGEVTGVYIADEMIRNGRFDAQGAEPVTRMGYMDYAGIDTIFELRRPGQ